MSNDLEEIDRHIEVLSSRWPKPYRQLDDAMVARALLVASQIAHHRETTAAYGMAIRKQERIEEAERECAALKARLEEAERLLRVIAEGGYPSGMANCLNDIDAFLRAADSAPAALDLERVEIARCPRCGAPPRPTLMGRTVCPNGHGDVDQPMPAATAPAAPVAHNRRWSDGEPEITVHTSYKEKEVARMIRDHQKIIDAKRKSCPRCYGTGAVDAPTSADDPSCPECDGEGTWAK